MKSSLELQCALVAALRSDAALVARELKLCDGPPADARTPSLSVGHDVVTSRGWQGGEGWEHRFSVTMWDKREGFAAIKEVLADVERAVLTMPRVSGGIRVTRLRMLRATVRRAARNFTQGILEFQAFSVREN